jgi:Cys-tRNA(Pro)/Cys-tRNA(Cys) deacylase
MGSTGYRSNVTRLLDSRRVAYCLHEAEVEEKISAVELAHRLGIDPHRLYKTLVVVPQRKAHPLLVLIPGDEELDLKALRARLSQKDLRMATHAEAESQTGLLSGGISPLALLHRGFEIYADDRINDSHEFHVSAGKRGKILTLVPGDFLSLTGARILAGIARPAVHL